MDNQFKKAKKEEAINKETAYAREIKVFLESPAWREYALPIINQSVQKELPKPNIKGWQDKYVYAHALASAFSMIINALTNLSDKENFNKRMERYMNQSIDEA
jgi:hypothetical protein